MKPIEFWNTTYREIIVYCEANICRYVEDFRNRIKVEEASTDKIIQSNPLLYEKPKTIRLIDVFKNIFKKEEKEQSLEEQRRIFKG